MDRAAASGGRKVNNAYGGVLVNDLGHVLLRRVANNFGGYVWSWPKGRQDPGESPEATDCARSMRKPATRLKSSASYRVRSSVG